MKLDATVYAASLHKVIDMCQPILSSYMSGVEPMYRGTRKLHYQWNMLDAKPFVPRQDRKPLHSSNQIHNKVDQYFAKKFGIKGRSATTFAIQDEVVAEGYGPVGVLMPVGAYQILYSPNVADLQSDIEEEMSYGDEDALTLDKLERWLDSCNYEVVNDIKDVKSNVPPTQGGVPELMVVCNSFFCPSMMVFSDIKRLIKTGTV